MSGATSSSKNASGALGLAFASVLAWLCCLPVATGAFGIALAAVAAVLAPWWPLLASASILLLAVAVIETLRGGGGEGSDRCKMRNRGRRQWLFVGVVGAFTLGLLTLPWWSPEITYRLIRASPPSQGRAAELRDLEDLDELRTLVDRDKTIPRLVLLLSPT